jgi:hypothetical protein
MCPRGSCSGPAADERGFLNLGEPSTIDIVIDNVESGTRASLSFAPDYVDHPARSAECHDCRVASVTLPLPE